MIGDLNGLLTSLRMPQTKEQKRAAYSKWYKSEKGQAFFKAWYEKNRERLKEKQKIRNQTPEGRVKRSNSFKKWRAANLESEKARWVGWYSKNKAKVRITRRAKRDAVKNAEYSRLYYDRMKDDPEFKRKNRAKAKIGKMKRRAIEMLVPIGSQKLIAAFVRKIRKTRALRCYYCRQETPGRTAHVDHVVPIARGGAHDVGNLCAACPKCNLSKSSKMPSDFAMLLPL